MRYFNLFSHGAALALAGGRQIVIGHLFTPNGQNAYISMPCPGFDPVGVRSANHLTGCTVTF